MRNIVNVFCVIMLFIFTSNSAYTQEYKYEIGGHLSTQHYNGDLARKGLFSSWDLGAGANFRYNINFRTAIHSSLNLYRLRGDSKWSDNTFPTNTQLSFTKILYDISVGGEYNFYPYSDKFAYLECRRFSPFIGAGIGSLMGKSNQWQIIPFIQTSLGIKYKPINRLNVIISYNLKYTTSDKLEATKQNLSGVNDPFGVHQSFLKGTDLIGILSLSITWDIAFRKESNCH